MELPSTCPTRPPARRRSTWRTKLLSVVGVLGLAACGSPAGTDAAGPAGPAGVGPIVLAQGASMAPGTSTFVQDTIDRWNAAHPDQRVTIVELPENADGQYEQLSRDAETGEGGYDAVVIDTAWTAEFAANGYLIELPQDRFPMKEFMPPVVAASMYEGKLYTAPRNSDAGMLYYRTDLLAAAGISAPPTTWGEMIDACARIAAVPAGAGVDCYAGQLKRYEGLTVNVAEAIASAGGVVVDDAGHPRLDTLQAGAGLDFLVDGLREGYIPQAALSYDEEASREAFQAGKLVFQRQWPYQYEAVAATDGSSAVAGRFAVAPLPGLTGPGVSNLGGHAVGISRYSTRQDTALEFIEFYTSPERNRANLEQDSRAPVYTSIYQDPALRQQYPFLPVLEESIRAARPRPPFVRYGEATAAIQEVASAALRGELSSEQALGRLQGRLAALQAD